MPTPSNAELAKRIIPIVESNHPHGVYSDQVYNEVCKDILRADMPTYMTVVGIMAHMVRKGVLRSETTGSTKLFWVEAPPTAWEKLLGDDPFAV